MDAASKSNRECSSVEPELSRRELSPACEVLADGAHERANELGAVELGDEGRPLRSDEERDAAGDSSVSDPSEWLRFAWNCLAAASSSSSRKA